MQKLAILPTLSTILVVGCAVQPPCAEDQTAVQSGSSQVPGEAPFRSSGNPYEPGPLAVRSINIDSCEDSAPIPLLIYAPEEHGVYCVVVFQHGFMGRNIMYGEILSHLAGHGFVVVAPQMYEPGIGPLLGSPTAAEEAVAAAGVLDWISGHLAGAAGVAVRTDLLGLAGHSRGGKVAWLVLTNDPSRARAVAGVDPVDGAGGPLGNQARVVQGTFPFAIPSLVMGTGLGGSCAPDGDNHVQFYAACRSPAWHVVAPDYGHGDMLDDQWAAASKMVCPSGDDPAKMRRLTAGLLVAFFRGSLQGDTASYSFLTDTLSAPARIEVESK